MIKLFQILLLSLIFIGCNSKFSLQKRRYNKGFYFTTSKNEIPINCISKQYENKSFLSKKNKPIEKESVEVNKITHSNNYIEYIENKNEKPFYALPKSLQVRQKSQHVFFAHHNNEHKLATKISKITFNNYHKEPKIKLWDTILFVLVCLIAGASLIIGLGYLILFLSTSANYYLGLTFIFFALAALFFIISKGMNNND